MITLAYMYCPPNSDNFLCQRLRDSCKDIELCLAVQNIAASWKELSLALVNTLNAIRNKKNVARKPDLEFHIRFFVERQIHIVLDHHMKISQPIEGYRVLLVHHNEKALPCIRTLFNELVCRDTNTVCKVAPKPEDRLLHGFYWNYIKHHLGSKAGIDLDKIEEMVLGIIGCGDLLLKD